MATNKQLILAVLVACGALSIRAEELTTGSKDTIFVGELKVLPSVTALSEKEGKRLELQRVGETLESQFISALNATRQFQLVDRTRLDAIIEEQKLTELGQVDPNSPQAAKAMMLAGAKYAFLPQVDAFEVRTETEQYQRIGRTSVSRKVYLSAVVQIVDTTTGALLPDSPSIQLEKEESVDQARPGQATLSDQLLVEISKEMAQQLSQKVVAILRPAKVLAVTGSQIMINRGTEAGFEPGVLVEIYAVEKIVDEDTGEVYLNEMPVANAKVVRGDAKKCFAMIEGDNMGAQKGCVVRPKVVDSGKKSMAPAPAVMTPGSSEKPFEY